MRISDWSSDVCSSDLRWQFQESHALFGGFGWMLGIDGFALMLIMLSVFLMPICIGASWRAITERVPEYMAAFLATELLMIGTFAAQALFLFYRSAERRVGKEGFRTFEYRWAPYTSKKKSQTYII